jgi:MtN3 and saliva related transmembrane protein
MIQAIGFAAATLTALAFLPQVVKSWRTRSADNLSTGMLVSQGSGVSLWMVYGTAIRSTPIIVSNGLTLGLVLLLAYCKVRFRGSPTLEPLGSKDDPAVTAQSRLRDEFRGR